MEQLVARRAHNPKVAGSSPAPATKKEGQQALAFFRFNLKKQPNLGSYPPEADAGSNPDPDTKNDQ